jgi:glycosyltransferase involved in cell wall biosynthesis
MPTPAVTVVIPTYNRLELLRQTLASVFGQTQPAAEVIVVDDGSDDGSGEYLRGEGITVVANPGGGWGPARGRDEGFKQVSTELVCFLDSDDLLLPAALEQLAGALGSEPEATFAFGRSLVAHRDADGWHPEGVITPTPEEMVTPLPSLFARNFVPSVGTVARSERVRAIGGYPTASTWAEDHYFWIELARGGDPVFVPAITSVYRVHAGGRHDPTLAGGDLRHFAALAAADPRLAAAMPDRLGVQLCETLSPALRARKPGPALKALRTCLGASTAKRVTARRALSHWHGRRGWVGAGLEVWNRDPELAAWLARYS